MASGIGRGKTIFMGEHFVVYSALGIGFGLDKIITVSVTRSDSLNFGSEIDGRGQEAVKKIKEVLQIGNFSLEVISSDIPFSKGLGSGAAFAVATIRAISHEFELNLTNDQVCSVAFEAERVFHGDPSGLDNTLATFGGSILFQKRVGGNRIEPIDLPKALHLVMIDSGTPSNTGKMIELVHQFKEKHFDLFESILGEYGGLVEPAVSQLKNGDIPKLGPLMNQNQQLLQNIGVSTPAIEEIIAHSLKMGAAGAKLVGAGGGGYVMALAHSQAQAEALKEEFKQKLTCFYTRVPN